MKKSKRFLCMLIAAVMLLGAFPAHAASAPPAATYKAASPTRLPDGTTGAKVGIAGVTKLDKGLYKNFYGTCNSAASSPKAEYLFDPLSIGTPQGKANPTVYLQYRPDHTRLSDFTGKKIPAGVLVDVYYSDCTGKGDDGKFLFQYDTRGETQDFVIPCTPGDNPANPKPKKAPAPICTSFTDVQSGAWYYDAVTAVANGKLIHTVFDREPDGSFKPDAIVTGAEWNWLKDRLYGKETEGLKFEQSTIVGHCHPEGMTDQSCSACHTDPSAPDYVCPGLSRRGAIEIIGGQAMGGNIWRLKPSAYMNQNAEYIAKQKAAKAIYIDTWLDKASKGEIPGGLLNGTYERNYEVLKPALYRALDSGIIISEKLNDWTDLVKPVTRAELCVMLYRAGTTKFGSWTEESQTARMNAINP